MEATHRMHQQPGGVKQTRLMLRMRPFKHRNTFVLKATNGSTTITTRIAHQGQLKLVEKLVHDFVGHCTGGSATTATTVDGGSSEVVQHSPAQDGVRPHAQSGKQQQQQSHGSSAAAQPKQPVSKQQQQQQHSKKGKRR